MANRRLPTVHRVPEALRGIVVFREQRVFLCHYICDRCPNEWEDELLVQCHSWCPCCDDKCEPYLVEEIIEERPEFDLEDNVL